MQSLVLEGTFNVARAAADPATVAMESPASPGLRVLIRGYRGPPLPPVVHDPRLQSTPDLADRAGWRVSCREGEFEFSARGVEHHQALSGFFDPMLAGFALRSRDRAVVRVLLRLLRLPGGAWLMRVWHASRQ